MTNSCTIIIINKNTGAHFHVTYSGTWSEIHPSRYEGSDPPPEGAIWYFQLSDDISNELDEYTLDIPEKFIDYDDIGVIGWYSTTYGEFSNK